MKVDELIVQGVLDYYIQKDGHIPKIICPAGHFGMSIEVLENIGRPLKKGDMSKYGWGVNIRRSNARVIKALRTDKRFKECRVKAHRPLVAFEYLPHNENREVENIEENKN